MNQETSIAKLEAWIKDRQSSAGLRELAFYPGSDREISVEEAAKVALELLEGYDAGAVPTEK